MGDTRKLVLELPEEDAVLLDELLASATHPSNEASVSAALETFRSHQDTDVDRWIDQVGVPLLEEIKRDTSQLLTPEQAEEHFEMLIRQRRQSKSA